ncbi:MAG: restriction endonuclease [Nitrososphaerota archaeon]
MSYRSGRRFEYRVRDIFARSGWVVIRAAASKPVDLVCLKAGRAVLLECKYNRRSLPAKDAKRLVSLARRAGAEPVVALAMKRGKPELLSLQTNTPFNP